MREDVCIDIVLQVALSHTLFLSTLSETEKEQQKRQVEHSNTLWLNDVKRSRSREEMDAGCAGLLVRNDRTKAKWGIMRRGGV